MDYLARIKAADFLAVVNGCSNEETRYYLKGVHLSKDLCAVSTDGHLMAVRKCEDAFRAESLEECIIPDDKDLRKACKPVKTDIAPERFILVNADQSISVALWDGDTMHPVAVFPQLKLIDGTFPAWRNVIPAWNDLAGPGHSEESGEPVNFMEQGLDLRLLARIAPPGRKPAQVKFYPFKGTGNGPAVVRLSNDPDQFWIVMPCRVEDITGPFPDWLDNLDRVNRDCDNTLAVAAA